MIILLTVRLISCASLPQYLLQLATLTPNQLPITPDITPGFAVGGVFLIISGVAYTLIGIKNKWLHICLSAAYLASLSVTVLILYVMNPPVSNAIQGAYLVAIVMTGLILGGAAIVFKEMTEGLGCLLGGFCFSMWLLVLKPGGLLTSVGGIAGFISAFTLAAFATSFSHVTRPYGLIVGTSFGGATVIVLGIDCFSRAGLKEFWAYLWNLNDNLFPAGATTYPLTRGLRVEIAAIVVIFLAGIISQMKLWNVIKARREQRAAEKLNDEKTMEQEEKAIGQRIEQQTAQDRDHWETVYGGKDVSPGHANRDSGVGDMESKKGPMSTVTSIRRSGEDDIELADMLPTLTSGAGLVMTNKGQDGGPVTIRVARDAEVPQALDEFGLPVPQSSNSPSTTPVDPASEMQEQVWVMGSDGETRLVKSPSNRYSKRVSGGPEVVPLPFKVPEENIDDDRSSIATFADDEQAGHKKSSPRLSGGSALLRRLSKRSQRNSQRFSRGEGNSTEDLVIPQEVDDDRASSIAATMDGLSDDEDMRSIRSFSHHVGASPDAPNESQLAVNQNISILSHDTTDVGSKTVDISTKTDSTIPEEPAPDASSSMEENAQQAPANPSLTSSTDPKPTETTKTSEVDSELTEKKLDTADSGITTPESKAASITKDRLPAQLSKVVMSYRTNEWAKHLSTAEAPDLEDLTLEEPPAEEEMQKTELAAPVNVEALQQTAENGLPPPHRSMSQASNHAGPGLMRSSSSQSKITPTGRLETSNGQYPDGILSRSVSQQSLRSQQGISTRGLSMRNSSTPNIPQPIVESPIEENYVSSNSPVMPLAKKFTAPSHPYGSSNTLIGKRDSMVRNKSSYFNDNPALASTPELAQSQFQGAMQTTGSESGSIYNAQVDDDNMSLSARRKLIRQSSLQSISGPSMVPLQQTPIPFDTHQPRRLSSAPTPIAREQQLASWRASVQNEFQTTAQPRATIERSRSALWQERQAEEHKRAMEARRRVERDSAFDQRMRRGDMLDAHRDALRRMQATANKHT